MLQDGSAAPNYLEQQNLERLRADMAVREIERAQKAERERESKAMAESIRLKKVRFRSLLSEVYEAASRNKPLPKASITEILTGAQAVSKKRIASVEGGALVQGALMDEMNLNPEQRAALEERNDVIGGEMTFVVGDHKQNHDRAVIVSYDHHLIERLKDVIERLNPQHAFNSATAPVVEACTDLYSNNKHGVPTKSGRLIVVRNLAHLDFERVRGLNSLCRKDAPVYQEIVRQLCELRDRQKNNHKNRPS